MASMMVGLADGSVRAISSGVGQGTFYNACTPAGGEVLTQLSLGHVKGEIPHKKAYCHTVFSRGHEG